MRSAISNPRKPARPALESNNGEPVRPTPGPPLAELEFDSAYRRYRLTAKDMEQRDDLRLEFWDRATQTALEVREPTTPYHERPSQLLAKLTERIAAVRGKPIACFGTMDLALPGEDGRPNRILQADQSLYLHPWRANIVGPKAMVVGENHYPDIVLEVDHTTDVRRHKLKLYEAWRFPEVWVDVPDESPRPKEVHGATLYVLDGREFRTVSESRAFPGWTAEDIHVALNEEQLSERTVAILERIGARLGEREGTGPDDDPLLRSQRRQARAEGRAAARAKDLAQRAELVRHLMAGRGLRVSGRFPLDVPHLADAELKDVADAAMHCSNEADFRALLDALRRRTQRD